MSPKQKAQELIEKFKPIVYPYIGSSMLTNEVDEDVILKNAKVCAIIHVDDIIDCVLLHPGEVYYWQAVKAEINGNKQLSEHLQAIYTNSKQ